MTVTVVSANEGKRCSSEEGKRMSAARVQHQQRRCYSSAVLKMCCVDGGALVMAAREECHTDRGTVRC